MDFKTDGAESVRAVVESVAAAVKEEPRVAQFARAPGGEAAPKNKVLKLLLANV